ncbi:hypothetical protein HN615_12635 [Candidatus Woesearchaeota archaeon]|jgi:hypothetical protein|nr:hypothetical protein [Candidatus Woesearchaeota archaeon]
MAEKIGWELFRVEYKAALEKGDDIGTAIADSYDKAVKTAVPGIPYFGGTQKGQGSATVPGIIVKSPLKKLMAGMLNMCLKNPLPVPPFSVALDTALKIYWTGAVSSNMCVVVVPGVTGAFIDAEGMKNKSVDDFIDQLIKAFDTHAKQVQGIGVPLGNVPTVFTGYKVPSGA